MGMPKTTAPRASSSHRLDVWSRRGHRPAAAESREMEVNGGQQDDRARESEGPDAKPVGECERRADRQKTTAASVACLTSGRSRSGSCIQRIPAIRAVTPVTATHGRVSRAAIGPACSRNAMISRAAAGSTRRSTSAGGRDSRRRDLQQPVPERHEHERRKQEERNDDVHGVARLVVAR